MTALELLSSPDFCSFLACWERDRRCPIALADWLLELDPPQEDLAAAAAWAATVADRPVFWPMAHLGERDTPCGLFPIMTMHEKWFWKTAGDEISRDYASDLPLNLVSPISMEKRIRGAYLTHDSVRDALVWYLDHYAAYLIQEQSHDQESRR